MPYNENEARARIEQVRREKEKLEAHKQTQEKTRILGKIEERRQNKQIQKEKNISLNKKKRLLISIISWVAAAAIIISPIVYLGHFFINRGKFICGENRSQMEISPPVNSPEFADVTKYLGNILNKDGDNMDTVFNRIWISGTAPELKGYGNKLLNYIRKKHFKISSLQVDRSSGYYFVMCDFRDKGNYYFVIQKQNNAFRLLSVDFF